MSLIMSIDIGGTFSDIIVLDKATGEIKKRFKVASTPDKPEFAIQVALQDFMTHEELTQLEFVFHATTIATNALLGQVHLELAKTILITTKGFRDVLEIGRQRRPKLYDFFFDRPKPIVPRRFRLEVTERINYKGEVLVPLNYDDLERISKVIEKEKVKSVAICFLHSYANPLHELEVKKFLSKRFPDLFISVSSEISPEYREYERTSTTVINAVLMPIVTRYIASLQRVFKTFGSDAKIFIMQSNGGVGRADLVKDIPVSIIESGPSAGVIATQYLAKFLGIENALSFDMGGTTAKAGTIINGEISLTTEYEVGGEIHSGRIIKGSGYPVRYPFIELAEVSSGGGSIAWVDEGGGLHVGPISAGADPGPACYGKGGTEPTITDANLVLRRINPKGLLNGTFPLYPDLAKSAIENKISHALNIDLVESAYGIIKIANTIMSRILRIVTIERGHDPRQFTMVAYGGAGPMHACALAEELGIKEIIIPPSPGLFSSLGLLFTDVSHTFVKSIMKQVDEVDASDLENQFKELEERGQSVLREEGFHQSKIVHFRYADMRYTGQGFELLVPLSKEDFDSGNVALRRKFEQYHKATYGYIMPEETVEIVNIRVKSVGHIAKPRLKKIRKATLTFPDYAIKEYRQVYFEHYDDFFDTPVFTRDKLLAGNRIEGPAIIEQYDCTTVVYPDWTATVDSHGIILLRWREEE